MNVSTCTPVQYRQIALILNNSAQIRYSTNTIPITTDPSLAQCTACQGARQPHRVLTAAMNRKNASPSTATGIPSRGDSGLVVTLTQFTAAFSGQAKLGPRVKCSYIREEGRAT